MKMRRMECGALSQKLISIFDRTRDEHSILVNVYLIYRPGRWVTQDSYKLLMTLDMNGQRLPFLPLTLKVKSIDP